MKPKLALAIFLLVVSNLTAYRAGKRVADWWYAAHPVRQIVYWGSGTVISGSGCWYYTTSSGAIVHFPEWTTSGADARILESQQDCPVGTHAHWVEIGDEMPLRSGDWRYTCVDDKTGEPHWEPR